jgi:hypothetical protein
MMVRLAGVVFICGIASLTPALRAQGSSDAAREKLVAGARDGTAQYQNVNVAIADGFKRVGVELPAMGEHWVSLSRVLENRFDARRPSVLIYITTRGQRRLAGVGYTSLLSEGEQPPPTAARVGDWHEHNGSVVDESLPVHGHDAHSSLPPEAAALGATRLAILHVWAWAKNPAGTFVTENWSLPLARLGKTSRQLHPAAVRAVSLANDSASYYEQTLKTSLGLTDAESRRVRAIVDGRRRAARAELARRPTLDETALTAIWRGLWAELERGLPTRLSDLGAIRAKL